MTGLHGRTAIVTGGAGGIGRALVAPLDRAAAPEDAAMSVCADVSHAAEVDAAVKAVTEGLAWGADALGLCGRGGLGVRGNAVAPGPVQTPMLAFVDDMDARQRDREAQIPMARVGEPRDLVGAVLFPLGDDSRHRTGQIPHGNGGMLLP